MSEGGSFTIEKENGILRLTTGSFKTDRGSVLHSGIFNKELASSFVAAIVSSAFIILIAAFGDLKLFHYFIAAIIFVVIFPLSRIYVFKEHVLETTVNSKSGKVLLTLTGPLGKKKIESSLAGLRAISVDHIRIEPENPDGIKIVEKIALQHGTVIPGFGEVKEFFNVDLRLDDEKVTVLTTSDEDEARSVADELRIYAGR
jgi:hypothetical protein